MLLELILTKTAKGFQVARQIGAGELIKGSPLRGGSKGSYLAQIFPDARTARLYAQRVEQTGMDKITWQVTDTLPK